MTDHPDAPPGKAAKYARVERERRFLLAAVPTEQPVRQILIEDRYLRGTRLRLRRSTSLEDPEDVIYKLTQKVPAVDETPSLITNMYLSRAEYDTLVTIPADTIRKIRRSLPPLGVDRFEGALRGLLLAEVEFDDEHEERAFEPSITVVAEVTDDIRFTGGALARMTAARLSELLAEFGVRP